MLRVLIAVAGAALLFGCALPESSPSETAAPTGSVANPTEASQVPAEVTCRWARVRSVTDGDTIRVEFEDGPANEPVRYIGIDTPETVHPTLGKQPFGEEASAENVRLVAGKRVCLEKDVSEHDRFGRLLRYVWLSDGTMVNELLVRAGLATVDTFPPDVKYVDRFTAAQAEARTAERGIWAP